ncbi:MAG: FAD:protein FMN transferase, partial [SAR324 cluster bacterium]|nr:FAD:protein FMN transferase [SAR324 cluster bacterium]
MRFQMGSLTEITVPDGQYSAQSVSRAFDVVDRLDRLLSTYKADSEVSRLAALGRLRVSPETMEIAEASLRLARLTGGAFNPMLGPVIALWRQAEELGRLPSPEALEAARTLADFERVELDRLLAESDFLSIHVSLSEATHHLIGARELARMKPTACLVNTARGPVIDEPALVQALRRGRPGCAGLDGYER